MFCNAACYNIQECTLRLPPAQSSVHHYYGLLVQSIVAIGWTSPPYWVVRADFAKLRMMPPLPANHWILLQLAPCAWVVTRIGMVNSICPVVHNVWVWDTSICDAWNRLVQYRRLQSRGCQTTRFTVVCRFQAVLHMLITTAMLSVNYIQNKAAVTSMSEALPEAIPEINIGSATHTHTTCVLILLLGCKYKASLSNSVWYC